MNLGLHITLAKQDGLVIGTEVKFEITGLTTYAVNEERPKNTAGQFEFGDNTRHYPASWIAAEAKFVGTSYDVPCNPHLSSACIAVRLKVSNVTKNGQKGQTVICGFCKKLLDGLRDCSRAIKSCTQRIVNAIASCF